MIARLFRRKAGPFILALIAFAIAAAWLMLARFIGRDPAAIGSGSTHRVNDASVSKTHVSVSRRDGQVWVEDLHSTNGTAVRTGRGETSPLRPGVPVVLQVGDVVEFGEQTCALEVRQ